MSSQEISKILSCQIQRIPQSPTRRYPVHLEAPPSPDYVPGPEEPEQAPLLPEFVPEPVYPEFMPLEDEDRLGDDDDDDESSDDNKDDNDDVEEEEEEHPAPTDSVPPPIARLLAIPSPPPSPLSPWSSPLPQIPSPLLLVSSPVHVSPLLLPASPTYPLGFRAAMIRQRAESSSTSHSLPLPPPIILSHTRAFVAMMRAAAPSIYILASRSEIPPLKTPPSGTPPLLPIPAPTSSPPLLLPSTNHRADKPKVGLPPRKRLCIALGPRYEVGESSSAPAARPTGGFRANYGFFATLDREIRRDPKRDVGYGITDTWDEMLEGVPGEAATKETELGWRMTNFIITIRQDTDEIYRRLDEAQEARAVLSAWLNLLGRDRRSRKSTEDYCIGIADEDCSLASGRPCLTGIACGDTKTDEYTADTGDSTAGTKMAPKRTTRANPADTTATTSMTNAQLKTIIDQGVIDALAARDADRNTNGDDNHDLGKGVRRTERVARECTYPNFMKCQPLNFKGTEGVVELIQWFEKIEIVFSISNCSVENQIKFSTCTLLAGALMWWNSYVRTVGHDVVYVMTWTDLKKKMTGKYCPRGEIKKLEAELMFPKESDKIERYVSGLLDMIYGSVIASSPKIMQEAIKIATELIDKKIHTFVERQKPTCYECGAQVHFKRDCPKLKNNTRGNQGRNGNASGKVYSVGRVGTNPDSNVVTGTFLLNNRYASVLFDTGADRSFVSIAFSS
ncbi:reverse transcriptase domain-containing protein [Tanacetum coccineum]